MTEAFDDDFNLSELDDQELVTQMHDDLYDGLKDELSKAPRFFWIEVGVPRKC